MPRSERLTLVLRRSSAKEKFGIYLAGDWDDGTSKPVVKGVLRRHAAARSGLMRGDRICCVNGQEVKSSADVMRAIGSARDLEVELAVFRKPKVETQFFGTRTMVMVLVASAICLLPTAPSGIGAIELAVFRGGFAVLALLTLVVLSAIASACAGILGKRPQDAAAPNNAPPHRTTASNGGSQVTQLQKEEEEEETVADAAPLAQMEVARGGSSVGGTAADRAASETAFRWRTEQEVVLPPTPPPDDGTDDPARMADLLGGFPLSGGCVVKPTASGMTVSNPVLGRRLSATVPAVEDAASTPGEADGSRGGGGGGSAGSGRCGGAAWRARREEWVAAIRRSAAVAAAVAKDWRGVPSLASAAPDPPTLAVGDLVVLRGLKARPELVGRTAEVVVAAASEEGARIGVRLADGGGAASASAGAVGGRTAKAGAGNAPAAAAAPPLSVKKECAVPLDNRPLLGVSAACLREFRASYRDELSQCASVGEAVHRVIRPLTARCGSSVAGALQRIESSSSSSSAEAASDAATAALTGTPTHFLLASDVSPVHEVLEAAARLLGGGGGDNGGDTSGGNGGGGGGDDDGFIWLDLLCCDYGALFRARPHGCGGGECTRAPCAPPLWTRRRLSPAMRGVAAARIGVFASPLADAPLLTRWPLAFQISCTLLESKPPPPTGQGGAFAACVALSDDDSARLDAQLATEPAAAMAAMGPPPANADAALDQGSASAEEAAIFRAAARRVQPAPPDATAAASISIGVRARILEPWMVARMERVASRLSGEARAASPLLPILGDAMLQAERYVQAEPMLREVVATYDAAHGRDADQSVLACARHAFCLARLGKHAAAEPLWRRVATSDHPHAESAGDSLVDCLMIQGGDAKVEEAIELLRGAVRLKRERHGPSHGATLRAMHNFAAALGNLGQSKAMRGDPSGHAMMREAMEAKAAAAAAGPQPGHLRPV